MVNVVCLLGSFPALSGLSLAVSEEEIVAVLGPNGAGKSTLLRACAGLQPISAGNAIICGVDIRRNPRLVRQRVGYLGHRSLLYDDLTVEDNVTFAVRASGGDRSAVKPAMDSVGIMDRVAALPLHACSAGQRRRAALATVIARKPKLWLLDEPHSSLDAEASDHLDEILRSAADQGATIIVVSHDHDRASSLATRVVTIAGGYVVNDSQMPDPQAQHSQAPDLHAAQATANESLALQSAVSRT